MVAAIASLAWLSQSTPADFTARLSANAPVILEYAGDYTDKKSPACGCAFSPDDEWRGITFVARRIQIDQQADAPHKNAYMLSPAFPSVIGPLSSGFHFSPSYYEILVPEGQEFEPRHFANRTDVGRHYRVLQNRPLPIGPALSIFTSGPLNVETLGEVPVGAWIPSVDGRLRISRDAETGDYQFFETVDHQPETAPGGYTSMWQVVDLLGPRIIAWIDQPARIFAPDGFTTQLTGASQAEGGGIVLHVFVLDVPFALRVGVGAMQAEEATMDQVINYRNQRFGAMIAEPLVRGSVVADLSTRGADYRSIRRQLEQEPEIVSCGVSGFEGGGEMCMSFRRPDAPRNNGLNIYGRVRQLRFESVVGSMMVGSRHIPIDPPVPVNVLEASGFDHPLGTTTIPIEISNGELTVSDHFVARGDVTINGEPVSRRMDKWATPIGAAAILSWFAGWASWGMAFWKRMPRRRR